MTQRTQQNATTSAAELVEQLIHFDGPPDEFLQYMLAVQCRVGQAEHAAIVRPGGNTEGGVEVLAVYPRIEGTTAPVWLAQVVEIARDVIKSGRSATAALLSQGHGGMFGEQPGGHVIVLPLRGGGNVRGAEAFVVYVDNAEQLRHARERLELTVNLLGMYEMRLTLQKQRTDMQRIRRAGEVLVEVNEQGKYRGAAMAMCNQIAAGWDADRVSIGLLKGRYVKVQAISHTEKFTRKMELVQAIESAMEESLDQDIEVVWPTGQGSTTISRAASQLAQRFGPATVISLPLRYQAKVVGVLTLERPPDKPLTLEEVEALRLTCDLCTARLVELEKRDQWPGAKLARITKTGLGTLVGHTHTWAKVAAVVTTGVILFLVFARGPYRVDAPFVVEASKKQVITAPFDGYLAEVDVQPNDKVVAGQTLLAKLDTAELRLSLTEAISERAGYLKQAQIDRRDSKIADAQIAEAKAEQVQARMDLLQWQIDQADIHSQMDGIVIVGDLQKELGSPVTKGKVLFEVAPIESMRVELTVKEAAVSDLTVGQTGELASVSHPGEYLKFEVERIDPVAEVVNQRNVFRVRGKLLDTRDWLRPGMEGTAKVDVDERSYAWIWTHELINWVRMKLWL